MRSDNETGPLLVCFGASAGVRIRLWEFIEAKAWEDVERYPFILFDLVLEGLYFDVDATIRAMTKIFNSHEHVSLVELSGKKKVDH